MATPKKPLAAGLELDMRKLTGALERERVRRELTHQEVADQLHVTASAIWHWRRRQSGMTGDAAVRVADWLDVDLRSFARHRPARPGADLSPAVSADAA